MKEKIKMTEKVLKKPQLFALMIIPVVWLIETTIMAPGLGLMTQTFPDATNFQINMAFSIPYITSIIFSALTSKLSKTIDKKVLVVLGLFIYGITAMLPAFAGSLNQILIMRLITGIGVGLVLPMPNVYIDEYFAGPKRKTMLGWANAVAHIANICATLVAGALIVMSWRYSFFAFGIVIVIAIIELVLLPKFPPSQQLAQAAAAADPSTKEKLPKFIWALAAFMTLVMAFFAIGAVSISEFMIGYKIGIVAIIGVVGIFPSVGNIAGSLLSKKISGVLKGWHPFVACVSFAIGFAIYFTANSVAAICIAVIFVGFGTGLLVPYLLEATASICSERTMVLGFGIVTACIHLGVFLFPYIEQLFAVVGNNNELRFTMLVSTVFMIVAALLCLIVVKKTADARKKEKAA